MNHQVGLSGDGKSWIVFSIQCGPWRVVEQRCDTHKEAQEIADKMNAPERMDEK